MDLLGPLDPEERQDLQGHVEIEEKLARLVKLDLRGHLDHLDLQDQEERQDQEGNLDHLGIVVSMGKILKNMSGKFTYMYMIHAHGQFY